MRKIVILGLLVLLTVLAIPAVSAQNTTLYFVPQDSTASGCGDTVVSVMAHAPDDILTAEFGINYSSSCINIVDVEFNPSWMMTDWNNTGQPECWGSGHDWLSVWTMSDLSGPDVWICNITINCTDPSCTYCTSQLNFGNGLDPAGGGCYLIAGNSSGGLPVNVTNGTFTCGTPSVEADLNVTNIYLNPGDTRANETLRVYVNQSNDICAVVHNNGPGDVTGDFDVCFEVDGNKIDCVTVTGGLAAGEDKVVCSTWTPTCANYSVMPGYPLQSLPFTINVTADCNCAPGCCPNCPDDGSCGTIGESNEANNKLSMYVAAIQRPAGYAYDVIGGVVNNGYKSKHCDCDTSEDPLSDYWVVYRDLTCGGLEWNVTGAELTLDPGATDTRVHTIDLPDGASVKKAMLFVYWRDAWGNYATYPSACLANLSANMSSVCGTSPAVMPIEAAYHDSKGFEKYQAPIGVYIYNVTDWACTNSGNPVDYTVDVTNIDPSNQTKLMGQMLVVVYEGDGDDLTHIWINEGIDYLMAADATHGSYAFHVSPEEATATIPFSGTDTISGNISKATLTAVAAYGENLGSNLLFNGDVLVEDAWMNQAYPDSHIEVEEVSLQIGTEFTVGSTNSMGFMDNKSNGFYAYNTFLVVTEMQSVATATGAGDANIGVDKGCIMNLTALNVSDTGCTEPAGRSFPYGLFSCNITGLENGETVNVTIELPGTISNPDYLKVNTTNGNCTWYNVPVSVNGNVMTITLTDGGLGDNDGVADGQITDPGGPSTTTSFIDVDKLVWNGTAWVASTSGAINGTYRYKITVENVGSIIPDDNLKNFTVTDLLPAGLSYADTAVLIDHHGVSHSLEPPNTLVTNPDGTTSICWELNDWTDPDEYLQPGQFFIIKYNVTVTDCGNHRNDVNVSGQVNPMHYGHSYCWLNVSCPDLNVSKITLNPTLPRLCDMAFGPTNHTGARTQCNNISADIVEGGGVNVTVPFDVVFTVTHVPTGNVVTTCVETRPGMAAGATETVFCNCSFYPFAHEDYAINVTVDPVDVVTETDENNNTLLRTITAHVHGLKGNSHQYGDDSNISTLQYHTGYVNLTYSVGDSRKMQASDVFDANGVCIANWTAGNLSIPPSGVNIQKARLYVYYNWDTTPDWNVTDYFTLDFNGYTLPQDANYSDAKHPDRTPSICANCSGSYTMCKYNQPYGMVAYDVRHKFIATGDNTAELTLDPYVWQNNYTGITGMVLMVVYEHADEPERIICINEGFDLLQARDAYGTTSEEATTYAPFATVSIPDDMQKATLVTITNHAANTPAEDRNRLYLNGQLLGSGVWAPYSGSTEIGIAETDVPKGLLNPTDNVAAFQSHITSTNYGDFFEATNAILIVEKGGVNVQVPCVELTPTTTADVPITLGGITLYGAGTINLEYDPSVVEVVDVTSGVDSTVLAWNRLSLNTISISAENTEGVNGSIVFANVEFEPVCSNYGCSNLTLTVVTLVDTTYQNLPYYTTNCAICIVENAPPVVSCQIASPDTILNDNGRGRAPGTNRTTLSAIVRDDTSVASVTIDLSSIRGSGFESVSMVYDVGSDTWQVETNATTGISQTHYLTVNATDEFGNSNADKTIELTVLRRGDAYRNDNVDMGDALRIARYTVGLDNEPDPLVSDVVQEEVNDGVNMGDALYIARYTVGLETMAP